MTDRRDDQDPADDGEDFDAADALEQIVAYQHELEEKAKSIVETVRTMLAAMREDLVEGGNARFRRLHGAWYDDVDRQLTALGFTTLGEYHDATPRGDVPPEGRSFYRFARSGDGTVVASWFWFPNPAAPHGCVVLHTWADNGTLAVTGSGIPESGLPNPPEHLMTRLDAGISVQRIVDAHLEGVRQLDATLMRPAGMEEIIALRDADFEKTHAYRAGLGVELFEPLLRHTWGDQYEEEGAPFVDVIRENPHWWTGAEPEAQDEDDGEPLDPGEPPRFMFLMSRDEDGDGRGHITTMGLALRGLPELQMKELAANHCRGARLLIGAVVRRLVQHVAVLPPSEQPLEARLSGIELMIQPEDPWMPGPVPSTGLPPGEAVTVGLRMEEFAGERQESASLGGLLSGLFGGGGSAALLRIVPPGSWTGSADEWLIDVCRRLVKVEIPAAAPLSAFDDTMRAASERARRSIPELRHRLNTGLPAGHSIIVKTGLPASNGGTEYVWVTVRSYDDGAFVGTLAVEPNDLPEFAMGQEMRVPDADVFGRGIHSETDGMIEHPITDEVALDFGVDLPRG